MHSHGGHGGHSHGGHADGGVSHAKRGFDARRALTLSLVLNLAYLVVELGAGLYTGSLALLSDAAHMVSDVAALALALLAAHFARRPATQSHTYGLLRAEILGAFFNAVILLVACLFIFKEAVERLVSGPPPVPGWPVFGVATIGLLINLGSAWILWRSERHGGTNLNVRGALVHMLADALGSVGAMVSALLTIFGGFASADAAASIVIGALVLYGTWGILRDSTRVLLEAAPPDVHQGEVCAALLELDGVASVHDLHIWSIGSGQTILTAHMGLRAAASPSDVLCRAQALLRQRFRLSHSTLQVEPSDAAACRQVNCGLLASHAAAGTHEADDDHDDHDPEHDHEHDDDHDHDDEPHRH